MRYEENARIDYVRIRLPLAFEELPEMQLRLNAYADGLCSELGIKNTCYRTADYFDSQLKRRIKYWSIWGRAAHLFFEQMNPSDLGTLMRLDYREEFEHDVPDFDTLYLACKRRNSARGSVTAMSRPYKEGRDGRDKGGEGIAIGGEQSEKRLSIYKRGRERPAIELQMTGKALRTLISATFAGELVNSITDHIFDALKAELRTFCLRRTGFTPEQIQQGIVEAHQVEDYTDPEQVLFQMDLLWSVLPDGAQEAFLESKQPANLATIPDQIAATRMIEAGEWEEDEHEEPSDFGAGWYTGDEPV